MAKSIWQKVVLGGFCTFLFLVCTTPTFAVDGWASMNGGTTGGTGGTVVTVDNAPDLKYYVETSSPYIVEVEGIIDLTSVGGRVDAMCEIRCLSDDASLAASTQGTV